MNLHLLHIVSRMGHGMVEWPRAVLPNFLQKKGETLYG